MAVSWVLTPLISAVLTTVIATGKLTGSYQIHPDSWDILLGYGELMMGILGRALWCMPFYIHHSLLLPVSWQQINCLHTQKHNITQHTHTHTPAHMWKSENYRNWLVLSFHHVGHRNWNQVIRLDDKCFNLPAKPFHQPLLLFLHDILLKKKNLFTNQDKTQF